MLHYNINKKLFQYLLKKFFPTLPIYIKHNPIALMKTNSEVEPAEMNGSGKPVGGIESVNTSYCTIIFYNKKRANFALS